MCIAIHKPKGIRLPNPHIEESFRFNSDGAGFAVVHNHEFVIKKGFFTCSEFNDEFDRYIDSPALVHFRIATSGGVSKDMCHPFLMCNGRYALIHNGVLDIKPHKGMSDTATFCQAVLEPILKSGITHTSNALKFLVESAIGDCNKMLIMDSHGVVAYFNENQGHTLDGIWYSNRSYLPAVYKPYKTGRYTGKYWETMYTEDSEVSCAYCLGPVIEPESGSFYEGEVLCKDCMDYALNYGTSEEFTR